MKNQIRDDSLVETSVPLVMPFALSAQVRG
jgi:hypothetical protein